MFRLLFLGYKSDEDVVPVFVKLTGQAAEIKLHDDMLSFLQRSFGPWCANATEEKRNTTVLKRSRG
jgi:hypothetical protein